MKTLPVTVLSGFSGAGKTTVLNHVLKNRGDLKIAVIVNDAGQTKGSVVPGPANEGLVQLSSGCICCTLRKDLLTEVTELAASGKYDYLLIESTAISEPMPIAETFTFVDDQGDSLSNFAMLDTMVTVVDAKSFFDDYQSIEELTDRGLGIDDEDNRDIARLLVDQIEFANVILLNKTDLVSEAEVAQLLAILKKLNPEAHVLAIEHGQVDVSEILNTGRFQMELSELAGDSLSGLPEDEASEADEFGISSFVYRARRPFHPQRFWDFWMEGDHGPNILRSKGYFWLATRNHMAGFWSQMGQVLAAEPGGAWWAETPQEEWPKDEPGLREELAAVWDEVWGDRRQELIFIGQDLDREVMCEDLDECLLTDAEMQSGPTSWQNLDDPFGPWEVEATDIE